MLQRIRERMSGWVAGIIIALVSGGFILFGIEFYFGQSAKSAATVATVNGVAITDHAVQQTLRHMKNARAYSVMSPTDQKLFKAEVVRSLIERTALQTSLQSDGFSVSLQQVKAMVESMPQFRANGQFSQERFLQALSNVGTTPSAFFQRMQSHWIVAQALGGVGESAFILPHEAKYWYALENQQRAFGYVIVPVQRFMQATTVTKATIARYYHQHKAVYRTPPKVSVSYLVLSPKAIAQKIKVTPYDAKKYYLAHVQSYQIPARWQIAQITVPVENGVSKADAQLAKNKAIIMRRSFLKNNATGLTADKMTFSAAGIPPALQKIVSGLSVGQASQPLRTKNGWTVIKLLKVMPVKTRSYASVEKELMTLIKHQRVNRILSKKSRQLSGLTYTNPDSLKIAATTLSLPIHTTGMMTQSGEKTGIFSNPSVVRQLFGRTVFVEGNNSSPMTLQDGSQIVLRIAKKESSQPIPLRRVAQAIKQKLIMQQASAKAGLLAYRLQTKIAKGAHPATLARAHGLQWHAVALIEKNRKTVVPHALMQAAFSARPKQTVTVSYEQHSFAVLRVARVKTPSLAHVSQANLQKVSQQFISMRMQLLQHVFVSSMVAHSKIKIHKG